MDTSGMMHVRMQTVNVLNHAGVEIPAIFAKRRAHQMNTDERRVTP